MSYDVDALRKAYEAVKAGLQCSVDEDDYRQLQPKLASAANLARVENRSLSLYDINRGLFILKVDNHMELLGFSQEERRKEITAEGYHAMIHPDDLPFMYDSEIKFHDFLRCRGQRITDYKLVYDYRVRAKSGSYIRFLHQMSVFECDRFGNSWIMLVVSDILERFAQDDAPRRFVIESVTGAVCLFNEEIDCGGELVSPREREVLTLIAQGLDSKAVADRLCISLHTVNNHRQNILRKTRTRHIGQAVYYLRCIGLV
jgi:DNA-binding CsgD family transcriptional regulator